MGKKRTGPLAVFGMRIKSIVVVAAFLAALLAVLNQDEIRSLADRAAMVGQPGTDQENQRGEEPDIVVDEQTLARAVQEVQSAKLAEMERGDGATPTDRFFYIVELVNGGDLEGVDLTIEPDQVILVSEGGTRTTINRTDVKQIHRHKLPPSKKP